MKFVNVNVTYEILECMGGSKKPPWRYYSYHSVITIISYYPETLSYVLEGNKNVNNNVSD